MENQVEDVSATPTFVRYAQAGLPLILPWHPTMTVAPGTLFHSRLYQTENPWAKDSPFVPESLGTTPVTFRVVDGGAASYKSVEGSSSSSNEEHLSVGLGVSADCMFLTASVSGQYDKNVQENKSVSNSLVTFALLILPGPSPTRVLFDQRFGMAPSCCPPSQNSPTRRS